MINFYLYYNKNGLDSEHYGPLLSQLAVDKFTSDLELVEHIIKRSPGYAYYYATIVMDERWREAEPYIMEDSFYAYWYAKNVIKGRFIEAEPYIMKDPKYAYYYAKNVIKGRFIEAEPYIHRNSILWTEYRKLFNI